ncbi:MAG TPA: signal peptidase II [Polyangiaceae bacterium]|nr:signal peptidase II [Polyangiaceae bacterium]
MRGTFALCALLLLVGCDHGTKLLAKTTLEPGARRLRLIPGVLDLRYTENHDTAFSLLRHLNLSLSAGALVATSTACLGFLVALWWSRRRGPRSEHVAYALLVGGALGNIIDRLVRGYVVDFIHLRHWPVFNVADIAIVFGAALLLVARLRYHAPGSAPDSPRAA